MDQLLDEIMELFDESDKAIDETKQKQEEKVKKAEEMRKRSLETFKEGAKRNGDEQQEEKQRKTRASGANTMAYLKERAETGATLKCEKLEIKRKELALHAKEQEGRQQQFDMMNKKTRDIQQLQQQQMQQFMNADMKQQHQQQTLALMELMRNLLTSDSDYYMQENILTHKKLTILLTENVVRILKIKKFTIGFHTIVKIVVV